MGLTFIALRPMAMAPEDTMSTSMPISLRRATCSATESMKSLDIEVWFLMIDEDPIFTTTLPTSPRRPFLDSISLSPVRIVL